MKIYLSLSKLLFTVMAAASIPLSMSFAAETIAAQPQNSLAGSWLVTVKGENRTRTLIVSGEAATSNGAALQAAYGMSNERQGPVVAEIRMAENQRQLVLVTQTNTKIVAIEQPDGNFQGTFTLKNGNVKEVSIIRMSATEAQQIAQLKPTSTIQVPGADVPAACAAFSGGWGGEWPLQGFISLWVVSIDSNCVAKVAYGRSVKPPTLKQTLSAAPIKTGALYLQRPDGGTTTFELKSDALSASYAGPGGANSAIMRRLDTASVARTDAEVKEAMAMVPPSSDVPAGCSAFYGQWVGTWSQGGFGEQYFRVAEVKSAGDKCIARYSYSTSKTRIPAKDTVEIKPGAFAFLCNTSTGGTCIFERNGVELWGTYSNPGGGNNNGVFRKID